MNNFFLNRLNGWHYLGVVIIYRLILVLLADAIYTTNDAGAKMIGFIATLPLLSIVFYFSYFREKRIYSRSGVAFYIFIFASVYLLIFGGYGPSDEDYLSGAHTGYILLTRLGPLASLYVLVYSCLLIFKNANSG